MSKKKKDYTKFSKPVEKNVVDSIEKAVVTDCLRLNVREAPCPNSDVVTVIDASSHIVVDRSESTDEFYKVITETGAEGFCMRKFITIIR